jgi:hypothetical protein
VFDYRQGKVIFVFSTAFRPDREITQIPSQSVSKAVCIGVKRPGREASSIAEINNDGAIF